MNNQDLTKDGKMPSRGGKISLARLHELPTLQFERGCSIPASQPVTIHFEQDRQRFDFLWHPNKKCSGRLFVLFSGDARRKKNPPPVFQRWSWAPYFPGHCLFVSDPMLFCHDSMGLCWYAGTENYDPMGRIVDFVRGLQRQLGVPDSKVYSYGSSGGGFAAIRFLLFHEGATAVAINPQTDITAFEYDSVERYLTFCFGGLTRSAARERLPQRFTLLENNKALRGRNLLIAQNLLDPHHLAMHYAPFCSAMGVGTEENVSRQGLKTLLFKRGGGHKKAEGPDVFNRIVQLISKGSL